MVGFGLGEELTGLLLLLLLITAGPLLLGLGVGLRLGLLVPLLEASGSPTMSCVVPPGKLFVTVPPPPVFIICSYCAALPLKPAVSGISSPSSASLILEGDGRGFGDEGVCFGLGDGEGTLLPALLLLLLLLFAPEPPLLLPLLVLLLLPLLLLLALPGVGLSATARDSVGRSCGGGPVLGSKGGYMVLAYAPELYVYLPGAKQMQHT